MHASSPPSTNGTSFPPYSGTPAAPSGNPILFQMPMNGLMLQPSRVSLSIDWPAIQAALTMAVSVPGPPRNGLLARPIHMSPLAIPFVAPAQHASLPGPFASTVGARDTSHVPTGTAQMQSPVRPTQSNEVAAVRPTSVRHNTQQSTSPAETVQAEKQASIPQPKPKPEPESEPEQEEHLTDEETGAHLHLDIGEAKIRGHELYTHWYRTRARHAIRTPRAGLRVEHGYLYVHRHNGGVRMWMWFADALGPRDSDADVLGSDADMRGSDANATWRETNSSSSGRWERVHSGHAHPTLKGYELHVLEDDTPRWASRGAARSYQKRMRMKARMRTAL